MRTPIWVYGNLVRVIGTQISGYQRRGTQINGDPVLGTQMRITHQLSQIIIRIYPL